MVANRKLSRRLLSPPRCGPALLHKLKEMSQGLLVGRAPLFAELAGALVELGSHLAGLVGRAAERHERGGEGIKFHKAKTRMSREPIRAVKSKRVTSPSPPERS